MSLKPEVAYQGAHVFCPWPACSYQIARIRFERTEYDNVARYIHLLAAWKKGPGVAGRCPGCGRYVLYSVTDKQAVQDPVSAGLTVLPDDWHQKVYLA